MTVKLPTLKSIMTEHGCDADAARSIRARMEVETDRARFRKMGRHTLDVISARDLARHPELAVREMPRTKFTTWKVEDHLKTMKARKAYIRAAAEEGSLSSVFDAFADVFRSMGKPVEAMPVTALPLPCLPVARRVHAARTSANWRWREAWRRKDEVD